MSRLYNSVIFYGVKLPTKASGTKDVSALFSGHHSLTEKAIKADLDVYCRSMSGYLQYENDDAFVFIGKRLAGADVDAPFKEFDESSVSQDGNFVLWQHQFNSDTDRNSFTDFGVWPGSLVSGGRICMGRSSPIS